MKDIQRLRFFLILMPLFGFTASVHAQAYISGPGCVMAGTVYMYTIQGKTDASPLQGLCITGGLLVDSGKSCIGKTDYSYARISWNSSSTGSIRLNSLATNNTLQVNVTTPLNGGAPDSLNKMKTVDTLTPPGTVVCSPASGGNCSPLYAYQWQQSNNSADWKDIKGATGQNLQLNNTLTETMYYRRKVVETKSGTVGYAGLVMVSITDIKTGN